LSSCSLVAVANRLDLDNAPTTAREKFGTQKGIGSDEFFGRAQFDPSAQTEARSRLQGFDGATSISSNAYFGRPEEDAADGEYGDMETAAKDFIRQFGITAGDDLENVTQLVGEGARQLRGMSVSIFMSENSILIVIPIGAVRAFLAN